MKHQMRPHVLDASALLRFLINGAGAETVERVLEKAYDADSTVSMSVINWGETLYHLAKRIGLAPASEKLAELQAAIRIVGVDQPLTCAATKLRLEHDLHYADCFAAATAGRQGTLVTADRHFKKIPWLRVLWLPEHDSGRSPR